MTKVQLKGVFMHGWSAYESVMMEKGKAVHVDIKLMEKAFEDMLKFPVIAAMITEEEKVEKTS